MQCFSQLSAFPSSWTAFGWGFQKGSDFFFFFSEEAASKKKRKKMKRLAECCIQTKQKTEKFTVHRCTWWGLNSGALAKESWLTVDCGCQGILVFRQGQTITMSRGRQLPTQLSQCVCVWVCMCCVQVIVWVPTVWTCACEVKTTNKADVWSICHFYSVSMNNELFYNSFK